MTRRKVSIGIFTAILFVILTNVPVIHLVEDAFPIANYPSLAVYIFGIWIVLIFLYYQLTKVKDR